ncbi:MAG: hypothetical protein V4579_06680 [Pseudomonadota bacterium]
MKAPVLGLGVIWAIAAVAPASAAPDPAAQPAEIGGPRNSYANPSAVIAAELALAQDAQVRGQWTALAAAAAPEAVLFMPGMVRAQPWLKGRPNPPAATRWQPHELWSSCDGSLMVSRGAWQKPAPAEASGPGTAPTGYYSIIWRRQDDGRYKWVLDHADTLASPLAAPEMMAARIADCPPPKERTARSKQAAAKAQKSSKLPPLDPLREHGAADDGSLQWTVTLDSSGARTLNVRWRKDGEERVALRDEVAGRPGGT